MTKEEFSTILKTERQRLNMSQRQLADSLSMGFRAVQMWEHGERIPADGHTKLIIEKIKTLEPLGESGKFKKAGRIENRHKENH